MNPSVFGKKGQYSFVVKKQAFNLASNIEVLCFSPVTGFTVKIRKH